MRILFIVTAVVVLYRQSIEFALTVKFFDVITYYVIISLRKLSTIALLLILLCTIQEVLH